MFNSSIFISNYYKNFVLKYLFESIGNDLYPNGDITTKVIFGNTKKLATAQIIAKENGIVAGFEEINWFFSSFMAFLRRQESKNNTINILSRFYKKDSEKIFKNEKILEFTGPLTLILQIERTILNLLQRMSGIATETFNLIKTLPPNTQTLIASTRKTPLGLIDKKAVVVGGGFTHRLNLSDAILIKDTHLDPFGRENLNIIIEKVLKTLSSQLSALSPKFIEIEVLNKNEAILAAQTFQKILHSTVQKRQCHVFPQPIIMLDNFSPKQIKETINELNKKNIQEKILIEASGGINKINIKKYLIEGIDIISLGYLTHSPKALDLSMKILQK